MIDIIYFKKKVKEKLHIDLFCYKEEQLHRRIKSFIALNKIEDIDEYIHKMMFDDIEKNKFIDFLTINVTEFYRNPNLYEDLSKLIKSKGYKKLKVWSAACSDGAEPYSIAIMLMELGINNFKIHATDIDKKIIEKAIEGIYDKHELKSMPNELIDKYFVKVDDCYHIKDIVKRNISFKVHDLLVDNFDKGYDLVLCRNVVIYFNTKAKDILYKNISNSIKKKGLFFIGATENISDCNNYNLKKLTSCIYEKN